MLNPTIHSNIRFMQKALFNTKNFAAKEVAEGKFDREHYEEVVAYVDDAYEALAQLWANYDVWEAEDE